MSHSTTEIQNMLFFFFSADSTSKLKDYRKNAVKELQIIEVWDELHVDYGSNYSFSKLWTQ